MSLKFLLEEDLSKAYGLYALSVIKGRALPDIRDGLKPVQRRILYGMYEAGYRYNKPYKKSARIVGEVLGKYHPHGDSPVYGALVNLAQEFGISVPLIQGQGNFGSIDGDNAASMRYTEARLAQISEYLLQDYEKNTVAMRYNYDETLEIPAVLPAQFPNLLVNGANGIAVGMATSIPPHNLGEVLDASIAMLENQDIQLDEIMQHIKGPDFPTGGMFFGGQDLKNGYLTGRGKIILQGSCFLEESKGKISIIIDSIPYQISKPKLIESITNFIQEGSLSDISDVRDESGKNIRIVLELKKDANVDIIQQRLFALTNLQVSISLNMVALHNDKPITFSLIEALRIFLQFREEVVLKRAEYILQKTLNRAHILAGLILATSQLDDIVKTIRSSEDATHAQTQLMLITWNKMQYMPILEILGYDYIVSESYQFSAEQARGILELKLHKLTKLERLELLNDLQELAKIIDEQKNIIKDRDYRKNLMKSEFLFLKEKFAAPRRTKILNSINLFDEDILIEKEEIVVMITANGYIKRINLEEYKVQNRGGKGKIGHKKLEDPILNMFITNTLSEILFFTTNGKVFSMKAYEIPIGSAMTRGRAALNLFKLESGERITTILPLNEKQVEQQVLNLEDKYLIFITTNGTIRRNAVADFSNIRMNGKIAMKLDSNNSLHCVLLVSENDELLLTSSNGNSIRFAVSDIRVFESRSSEGVRAINLNDDDRIIDATKIDSQFNSQILCVTENGYGKRSNVDEYRKIKRGGKGSKTMNINAKTGKLVQVLAVDTGNDILLMSKNGQTIRINAAEIRKTSRVASGVILMKLPANDSVALALQVEAED